MGTCYSRRHFVLQRLVVVDLHIATSRLRHAACLLCRHVDALRCVACCIAAPPSEWVVGVTLSWCVMCVGLSSATSAGSPSVPCFKTTYAPTTLLLCSATPNPPSLQPQPTRCTNRRRCRSSRERCVPPLAPSRSCGAGGVLTHVVAGVASAQIESLVPGSLTHVPYSPTASSSPAALDLGTATVTSYTEVSTHVSVSRALTVGSGANLVPFRSADTPAARRRVEAILRRHNAHCLRSDGVVGGGGARGARSARGSGGRGRRSRAKRRPIILIGAHSVHDPNQFLLLRHDAGDDAAAMAEELWSSVESQQMLSELAPHLAATEPLRALLIDTSGSGGVDGDTTATGTPPSHGIADSVSSDVALAVGSSPARRASVAGVTPKAAAPSGGGGSGGSSSDSGEEADAAHVPMPAAQVVGLMQAQYPALHVRDGFVQRLPFRMFTGVLTKRGRGIVQTWKKRQFLLVGDRLRCVVWHAVGFTRVGGR